MAKKDIPSYEIGYGKPPKHTQFKTGQSGNPHGRPRKVATFDDDVQQELKGRMVITEGGRRKKFTRQRVIAKLLVNNALGGHVASARIVVGAGRKQQVEKGDNLSALTQELRARHAQLLANNDKNAAKPDGDNKEGQDD